MRFENTTGSIIYITSETGKNFITFKIYGRDFGARYACRSVVMGSIPAPEEFTDNQALVRSGKDGIISESYLTVTRGGVSREVLLRRDKYAPQKRVTYKVEELPPEIPLPEINENIFS